MKTLIQLRPAALVAVFATLFILVFPQRLNADIYPPAISVSGNTWSGGGGSYSGALNWAGNNATGSVFVSSGIATFSGSYWVDGYFQGGFDYAFYGNAQWDPNSNWVNGTWAPISLTGSYSRGVFSIPGLGVSSVDANGNTWPAVPAGSSTVPPVAGGPPGLWVNGAQFYRFSSGNTDYYYSADYFDYIAISAAGVTSSDSLAVTGSYTPNAIGGVFVMSNPAVDVRPLASNGSMMNAMTPGAQTVQTSYGPPGVAVNGQQWPFQGTVGTADYYLGPAAGQCLTIANTLSVTLNDAVNSVVNATGYDNNGVYQDLPETVRSLDATGAILTSEGRGPASVIVNGVPWYHSAVGGSSYDAYFGAQSGQALYIYGDSVWLSDPYNNVTTSGTYAAGAFQFLGAGDVVQAGDAGGVVIAIDPQARTQNMAAGSNVNGNMDVFGNLFTLGTWTGDPSTSGLCLSFQDQPPGSSGVPATISLVANRASNQWMWSHATSSFTSTMPMMKLDAANCLTLYSSVDGTAQIVLNPQGSSTFQGAVTMQGPVHIQQRGDLTMGGFTSGPTQ